MIVLTGAGGKTGKAVLNALSAKSLNVRAVVYRQDFIGESLELGAQEAVWGDMRDPQFMMGALKGASAVYHICPNVHPEELAIGRNIIDAAKHLSVDRVVFHSVLHPQTEKMAHHWQKLRVEELILESGLTYIILQPAPYLQNILAYLEEILQDRIYTLPYNPTAKISMVDLDDVAQAAAILISSAKYNWGVYEITGTEPLSSLDVSAALSQRLGLDIRAEQMLLEDWRQSARSSGLGDYEIEALTGMFRYYDQFGLKGNNRVLGWILGREPTQLSQFVDGIGISNQKN